MHTIRKNALLFTAQCCKPCINVADALALLTGVFKLRFLLCTIPLPGSKTIRCTVTSSVKNLNLRSDRDISTDDLMNAAKNVIGFWLACESPRLRETTRAAARSPGRTPQYKLKSSKFEVGHITTNIRPIRSRSAWQQHQTSNFKHERFHHAIDLDGILLITMEQQSTGRFTRSNCLKALGETPMHRIHATNEQMPAAQRFTHVGGPHTCRADAVLATLFNASCAGHPLAHHEICSSSG